MRIQQQDYERRRRIRRRKVRSASMTLLFLLLIFLCHQPSLGFVPLISTRPQFGGNILRRGCRRGTKRKNLQSSVVLFGHGGGDSSKNKRESSSKRRTRDHQQGRNNAGDHQNLQQQHQNKQRAISALSKLNKNKKDDNNNNNNKQTLELPIRTPKTNSRKRPKRSSSPAAAHKMKQRPQHHHRGSSSSIRSNDKDKGKNNGRKFSRKSSINSSSNNSSSKNRTSSSSRRRNNNINANFKKRRARPKQKDLSSTTSKKKTSPSSSSSPITTASSSSSYSSLLPPPLPGSMDLSSSSSGNQQGDNDEEEDDPLLTSLSSWEDFLGGGSSSGEGSASSSSSSTSSLEASSQQEPTAGSVQQQQQKERPPPPPPSVPQRLPSIEDLFPPATTSSTSSSKSSSSPTAAAKAASSSRQKTSRERKKKNKKKKNASSQSSSSAAVDSSSTGGASLDGVLPVSDLFYRASRRFSSNAGGAGINGQQQDGSSSKTPAFANDHGSSQRTVNNNKDIGSASQQHQQYATAGKKEMVNTVTKKKKKSRKMVRRGMEMLVGGVPINADPPQRCVELHYNTNAKSATTDWASAISLVNTRDFGPLLHTDSIPRVSSVERGLYCEYFGHAALKWDISPPDLRRVVKTHLTTQQQSSKSSTTFTNTARPILSPSLLVANSSRGSIMQGVNDEDGDMAPSKSNKKDDDTVRVRIFENEKHLSGHVRTHDEEDEEDGMLSILVRPDVNDDPGEISTPETRSTKTKKRKDVVHYEFGGAIVQFDLGLSQAELCTGSNSTVVGRDGAILKSVLMRGVSSALKDELKGFRLRISHFSMEDSQEDEQEEGEQDGSSSSTFISVEFNMQCIEMETPMGYDDIEKKASSMMAAFAREMDNGNVTLALAEAARQETRWPQAVRDRVVEECLFQDDDDDSDEPADDSQALGAPPNGSLGQQQSSSSSILGGNQQLTGSDGGAGAKQRLIYPKNDLFLGGGNDGVFFDYSQANALNAPYKGELGLRLVDAVVERAKQRHPRVIVIGDVHGCIDELQDLLRQCDYRPGDLVVFLGDLVCKGPDSISVVQMAREIGAIGVRGNHDFEVIRWHRAIRSGVDPPVVGSEHFHIASCLSTADVKWMYSLPWFISSKELSALFVHAGFVSGIRLAKQNPRLMMNMRSILPDGTVTSKFFKNWPWARIWDGPQTVLFGHDADRGLQQYEHAIGLDTGCVYGGRLTACILPEKRLVSVSARREYFKYRRKHYD